MTATDTTTRLPDPRPGPRPSRLCGPVLTRAGARVDHIHEGLAALFLDRLPDAPWSGLIDLALGAVTDGGELVGVAVLTPTTGHRAEAIVGVTPARRRLGLGADLLLVLLEGAAERGVVGVTCRLGTDADAVLVQRLCRSLGLTPTITRSSLGVTQCDMTVPGRLGLLRTALCG